ncbi:TonB-dependent receptor [Aurantiacibacter marinus]|uniref:TonB-dependent receptor n=1 Tax=Aurantiacibacter marinus TaxID=874156 RepID=A0A0H0XQA7_9SPHN|nr:TonB-dependent receptor [Aurantiacibacter marinus]KLI64127.1 hypothetical protein AAV99_00100 [Aurantiacibacter marinus]
MKIRGACNGSFVGKSAFFAGVALTALCVPGFASAQDAPAPETAETTDDNVIIVSGIRDSLANALDIRRNADVVLDGISADDIGSTPDLNLGEALARIPGVQINREGARRDATISVRGLPGQFTKTTVMGQAIASTTRGSNTGNPFGIFESAIFNGANVIKSFTADTPAGGLAAQVDLRLNSALQRREGFAARAELTYEGTTEDYNPSFYFTGAQRLGDRFGVYGTVSYSDQSFRRDTFRINQYRAFSNAEVAAYADGSAVSGTGDTLSAQPNSFFDIAPVGENGLNNSVIYPQAIRQIVQNNRGYRVSGAAGLAYELTDNLQFRLDGLYTRRDLGESNQDIFITEAPNNGSSLISPLSNPVRLGTTDFDENNVEENVYIVPRIQVSDQQTAIGNRSFPALDESWAIYPQMNFENDDWRVDIIGTYSEATGTSALSQYDVRIRNRGGSASTRSPDANLDGIDDRGTGQLAIFDQGLGNLNNIFVDNFVPAELLDLGNTLGNWRIETGSAIGARDDFRITAPNGGAFNSPVSILALGFLEGAERDLASVDFDVARKFSNSFITEVGIGGYYSQENSARFRQEFSALGLNFPAITADILRLNDGVTSGSFFAGGNIPGIETDQFLSIDIPVLESQLGAANGGQVDGLAFSPNNGNLRNYMPELTTASAQSVTVDELLAALPVVPGTTYLPRLPQNRTIDTNFDSSRDTIELYGMAKFDFGEVSDFQLRGNVGGRYVRTDLTGLVRPISAEFYANLAAIRAANGGDPLVFREGAELNFDEANNTFERFLPSANLIYEITPDLVVRAAYYETFEALDLAEFSPSPTFIRESEPGTEFDDENADDSIVGADGQPIPRTTVSISSLDIEPRRSTGFDLGLSWYNRPGSVVAIGFFRKSLIGDISTQRNFCPAGEDLTVGGRTFQDIRFADVNSPNPIESSFAGNCVFTNDLGDPQRIRVNRSVNNPDTINVTGFEAQIQQSFDFLPGLLGNTGFVANYTRVRSGGDNDVQLFNVAEDTYNLIGYYEDELFQFRLAYNSQSEIQRQGGSSFLGGSTIIAPRDQLDFTGRIQPIKNVELRFEVFNITNTSRREYVGFEELFRLYEYDGRTYSVSTTVRF